MGACVGLTACNAAKSAAGAVLVYRRNLNLLLGAQGGKGVAAALTEGLAEFRGGDLSKADLYLLLADENLSRIAVVDRDDPAVEGVGEANEKAEKEG